MIFTQENLFDTFKINDNCIINSDYIEPGVEDSKFFVIDNFFKNPNEIKEYLFTLDTIVWKEDHKPSYNTIFFEDMKKFIIDVDALSPVYTILKNLCGYDPEVYDKAVANLFRFANHSFNNFYENYWAPHTDIGGYTGILYLNQNDFYNGTNIYRPVDPNFFVCEPEHYHPWIPKEKYELIITVPPIYNRLFFFNSSRYTHGMNICNNKYCNFDVEYRLNMVFNMNTPNFPCD
jgi:hypothetical protein